MSPVPEPMHGGRPGPGGGDEEEEFTTPAGLPPGPFLLSSSDEELDNSDQDNAHLGYQPLPQDCEAEQEVDYSSLSGLMSALATHGPNTIAVDEDERGEATGTQAVGEDRKETTRQFLQKR
ncbi:hypothetical protein GWK47_013286 [Chionoecetes opilio]|uniref:Uncharacterized protein n=1 Tax=Chionoecetes opilio TaxID=41210 RepID=A0A8J4XW96_CHIOP|nr:hypothetical protein GWK47_013286 [Chionoecetes opilio]